MVFPYSLIPFDPGAAYVARRMFRFNGKVVRAGQDFHTDDQRKMRTLFEGKFLCLKPGSQPQRRQAKAPDMRPAARFEVPPVPAGSSEQAEVVSRGKGWFDVIRGGQKLNARALHRADAEALAAGK